MTTTGDKGTGSPSDNLKALFTKEIEEALLDNRIDLAVHSLKDMLANLPPGLELAAVPAREDAHDVWISKDDTRFKDLPQGATVATGAVRRQAQLRYARPDLKIFPMRGNVDTRLQKLDEGGFDGIILALAGLKRLGLEDAVTETLSPDLMLPAVGQGALAIEARVKDAAVEKFVKSLNHARSHQAVLAERAFLRALGGNCQTPIAAYAQISGERLKPGRDWLWRLRAIPICARRRTDQAKDAEKIGQQLAQNLLKIGADRILN